MQPIEDFMQEVKEELIESNVPVNEVDSVMYISGSTIKGCYKREMSASDTVDLILGK